MTDPKLDLLIDRPTESIPEMVVRRIRHAIASGLLPPGRKLTERELVELTGVSRTSVREAMRHLQTLGLVEPSPSRGVRVARLGSAEVREIYEVRDALEPAAAELFVLRATDEEVAELVEKTRPRPRGEERLQAIYEFDELLVAGARNSLLASMLGPLHTRIHALRSLSVTIPGRLESSVQEYVDLGEAISARSPERAAEAAHRHIRAAAKAALEAVEILEKEHPTS
ncbi:MULTISPECIES: GntR family transcriptional regulator [Actinomadura]|uniref:FCD domain-containing protein n=1 Tax=Actinomadura litoris TaxID=2678616 RepID=A0A7K1KSI0_9ACTN|nr:MULTISPECIES: GntR family transcriptional regulator [Actinomadura]MBT2208019.1 GntR family transcriptional regulator [Actinomadura sp. NEAU-AAG7]MUN35138.1 FCD domain-containing protein [Actinomadura litoris]